jgi:putative membrane protein insertion efficiency factor
MFQKNIFNNILILFVTIYREIISPMFRPCCRYYPSCSIYALEALRKYGPFKGSVLFLKRILRCHPFSKGGYDPVP